MHLFSKSYFFVKLRRKLIMETNKYIDEFIANMNTIPLEQRMNLRTEYNNKYKEQFNDPNILLLKNLVKNSVYLSNNFEEVLISNNKFLLNPMDMIKCLSNIESSKEGQIKLLYFIKIICNIAKNYLPLDAETFYEKSNNFVKNMDVGLQYGIANRIIEIQEEDKAIFENATVVDNSSKDKSASFDVKNDSDENKKEDKKDDEKSDNDAVAENSSTDQKSDNQENNVSEEDKKKKREEKKKKNEENRKKTEKNFDYNSIDKEEPDLKNNKPAWYRVANRVAALLIQEEVQNIIGKQKFRLLIYNDGNDFAIINDLNNDINQGYNIFWFKEKEAERFTDSNLFNMKWAEAHQDDLNKFTA